MKRKPSSGQIFVSYARSMYPENSQISKMTIRGVSIARQPTRHGMEGCWPSRACRASGEPFPRGPPLTDDRRVNIAWPAVVPNDMRLLAAALLILAAAHARAAEP